MENKREIYELLSMMMSIGNGNTYTDYFMFSNEKLMGYSVSLIMEIDELLDKGYSKEDITIIIMECDFMKNDPELINEEAEYLRGYALRMLDIRYKLYLEEKEQKVKKHLFNK